MLSSYESHQLDLCNASRAHGVLHLIMMHGDFAIGCPQASLGYDASWPSWINGLQGNDVPSIGEDEQNEGTYYPIYVHSYEQDLYDFSYSMELSYLESYSLGQEDDDVMPVNMAQSITSADVSILVFTFIYARRLFA